VQHACSARPRRLDGQPAIGLGAGERLAVVVRIQVAAQYQASRRTCPWCRLRGAPDLRRWDTWYSPRRPPWPGAPPLAGEHLLDVDVRQLHRKLRVGHRNALPFRIVLRAQCAMIKSPAFNVLWGDRTGGDGRGACAGRAEQAMLQSEQSEQSSVSVRNLLYGMKGRIGQASHFLPRLD